MPRGHASREWWKEGVVYQIYPRSFQDSDADGIGDLPGIASRLGYLVELGIHAIWISPIFASPMADFGYDVSDFRAIDPIFGTLADFDRLLEAAHARGLKVILDFVPNHTSDRHPWFIESRSSRSSPKRDWYVWRDPKPNGSPPNNWVSEFAGPAWTFDASTGQYYYHAFLKEQPDLNWRNAEVRAAMLDILRFWFERGVDGFRVDAIHQLIEDVALRDNPPNPDWRPGMSPARRLLRTHTIDQPEVHDAIAAMRSVADRYGAVMIGEAYLPIDRLMAYYGADLTGFHLPFNFHLISTPWQPIAVGLLIRAYEAALPKGAWPNWVLGNHDRPRVASRIGPAQARVAAMLLLTLRGTPTIYQGEELGLENVSIPPEAIHDPWERNAPGLGLGRDPVRTPMAWSAGLGAGFTAGVPWLPLSPNYAKFSIETQARDPASMLSLYRALLSLRGAEEALSMGDYTEVASTDALLMYERRCGNRRLLIALNMTSRSEPRTSGPEISRILLSTHPEGSTSATLRGDEGWIAEVRSG
ncbi:MAG: alpha-amylase family glycosyl hydrolase [Hyphomicrobiales bacterium]